MTKSPTDGAIPTIAFPEESADMIRRGVRCQIIAKTCPVEIGESIQIKFGKEAAVAEVVSVQKFQLLEPPPNRLDPIMLLAGQPVDHQLYRKLALMEGYRTPHGYMERIREAFGVPFTGVRILWDPAPFAAAFRKRPPLPSEPPKMENKEEHPPDEA